MSSEEFCHVDIAETVNHISLCAGYGGIDLGLKRAIPSLRTVAFSEIEAFAVANLVAKMEVGLLDPAPVWTDLKTFPWAKFCGLVDILSGGYPCQPFSAAGKRLGKEDPRHLWPWIADGIGLCQPAMCFFENVEGHVTLGLPTVVSDLEEMGYQVSWGIFSAAEVGAPHQRRRVFILAVSNSLGSAAGLSRSLAWNKGIAGVADNSSGQAWPSRPSEPQHEWEPPRVVANANSNGDNGRELSNKSGEWPTNESAREQQQPGLQPEVRGCGESDKCLADPSGERTEIGQQFCNEECRPGRTLPREPEQPNQAVGNATKLRRTGLRQNNTPNFDEQLIEPANTSLHTGLDDAKCVGRQKPRHISGSASKPSSRWQTQPPLGRDPDGFASGLGYAELQQSCDNRTDELRLLGNGVVPQTAEKAFLTLLTSLKCQGDGYVV